MFLLTTYLGIGLLITILLFGSLAMTNQLHDVYEYYELQGSSVGVSGRVVFVGVSIICMVVWPFTLVRLIKNLI